MGLSIQASLSTSPIISAAMFRKSIYGGSTRTGGIGMSHTEEWPGYEFVTMARVQEGWDQRARICEMEKLAEFAMFMVILDLSAPHYWQRSRIFRSMPEATFAPAVRRLAPARGS